MKLARRRQLLMLAALAACAVAAGLLSGVSGRGSQNTGGQLGPPIIVPTSVPKLPAAYTGLVYPAGPERIEYEALTGQPAGTLHRGRRLESRPLNTTWQQVKVDGVWRRIETKFLVPITCTYTSSTWLLDFSVVPDARLYLYNDPTSTRTVTLDAAQNATVKLSCLEQMASAELPPGSLIGSNITMFQRVRYRLPDAQYRWAYLASNIAGEPQRTGFWKRP